MTIHSCHGSFLLGLSLLLLAASPAPAETWSAMQPLSPVSHECKGMEIHPANGGGFHAVYDDYHYRRGVGENTGNTYYVRYHRDGTVSTPVAAFNGFIPNPQIIQTGTNQLWVIFEDWTNENAPQAAVIASNDGGATWGALTRVSDYREGANVKYPDMAPFGDPYSGQFVSAWGAVDDYELSNNIWDGFRFLGPTRVGDGPNNMYYTPRLDTTPDRSGVWMTYGRNNDVRMRYFDGTGKTWSGEHQVSGLDEFCPWPDGAVNHTGRVCAVWAGGDQLHVRVSNAGGPSAGWAEEVQVYSNGHYPNVTAITGRDEFYVAYIYNTSSLYGLHWHDGSWHGPTKISHSVPDDFCVTGQICCDAWGTLYAAYEYWTDGPVGYFAVCRDFELAQTPTPRDTPPPLATPTITRTFTNTYTFTPTYTGTITNTPRNFTPVSTNTPTPTQTTTPTVTTANQSSVQLW